MNNLLMNTAQIISLSLLGLFVLELVLGFFHGFIFGWKKSLFRLARIVLCLILAIFITPAFYNMMLNMNLPFLEQGSVSGTVTNSLPEALTTLPETLKLLLKMPAMIVNPIVFVVIFILLRILTFFIWLIISAIIFKKNKGEKRGRLVGGLVGVAQGFILCLALLVPLAVVAGAYTSMEKQIDPKYNIENFEGEGLLSIIGMGGEYADSYRKSVPGAIYSFLKLDYLIYNPLTTVKHGNKKISLSGIGEIAGKGINIFLSVEEDFKIISNEASSNAEKEAAALRFVNGIQNFSNAFFDNGLIKVIINEYGQNLKDGNGEADLGELLGNEELGKGLDELLSKITDGDISAKLKTYVDELCVFLKGSIEDGSFMKIVSMTENSEALLNNENDLVLIGATIDGLLDLTLFKDTKEYFFNVLAEAFLGGLGEYAEGVELKMHLLKWEDMMRTIYRFTVISQENYDNSNISADIVSIINSMQGQPEESGIFNLIESALKGMLEQMNIDGIDKEYLSGKKLDIVENKQAIGELAYFMANGESFDNFANANGLSSEDAEKIDKLLATLNVLNSATGDLKGIINDVFANMLNLPQGGETISSMRSSLNAYKLIINAKSSAPETFGNNQAEELIDALMDNAVFDLIKDKLNDGAIVVDGVNKSKIEAGLRSKIAAEKDAAKIKRLEEIANLFDINLVLI